MERKEIAKRSSQYFFISVFVTGMHIAGNFVVAKIFPVAGYGAYSFLFLILTYGASLHLGLENAFGKQYPTEIGKRNKPLADLLRDAGFTFAMLMSLAGMLLVILAAIFWPQATFEKRWAYIIIGITLPIQMVVEFYRTFFRGTKEFGRINMMQMIYGTLEFVLRVVPVYYFIYVNPKPAYALIGLFLGLSLSFVASAAYAYLVAPERIRFKWDIPKIKYLFRLGVPIFICFLMDSLFKNGDKFMAKLFFHDLGMGYYTLGSQIAGLLYFVPFAIGWVIFPLMLQKYGETQDGRTVASFVFPPTSVIIQIILPFGAMLYLSMDFLIPAILSKYNITIPAAKILIPGLFFWCIVNMFTYFLIAMDDRKRMVMFQTAMLILNLFLNWFFGVKLHMYIYGIAWGTVIAYFLYSILIMRYAITKYFASQQAFWSYYTRILMLHAFTFTGIIAADLLFFRHYWHQFFQAHNTLNYMRSAATLHSINNEILLEGFGVFLLEMLGALIFAGLVSLAIRKYKILAFDAKFRKAWLES